MKTIKSIFSVLILTLAFTAITSCDVEPLDSSIDISTGGGSGITVASFTAKVNGENFIASSESIIGDYSPASIGNEFVISGSTTTGKNISITVLNPSVATFPANFNTSNLTLLQFTDISLGINGSFSSYNQLTDTSTGTVTITNFDTVNNKASGTFSFTAYNSNDTTTRSITNGVFNNITFENTVN
ncbi:DUF6252 family protein [Flavobacterium sp.]|jgi:hypothetical protein|uniref:DUF6252 family protein n=1 Tax=Flavobacterium sp. TaxID=239 RepID=UPI002A8061DD|nr:DUF6252 family protein [Flavobacterium sp.]